MTLDLEPIKARLESEIYRNANPDLAALVAEVERLRAKVVELEARAASAEALDDAIWEGCFGPMDGEWKQKDDAND
mgnify:CR=1 FL=1